MRRGLIILIAGAAVAVLIALAVGLRRPPPSPQASAPVPQAAPVPPSPSAADPPFLNIEGTRLAGSDAKGRRLWDLKAKTLQVDRSRNVVTLIDVTGQLFQNERPALVFKAPKATFFAASKDVELTGGVVGQTPDGRTLRAPVVRWDGRRELFVASGGVTVTQPGMIIRADRLTSDAAMQRPTFDGNISVQVTQ